MVPQRMGRTAGLETHPMSHTIGLPGSAPTLEVGCVMRPLRAAKSRSDK